MFQAGAHELDEHRPEFDPLKLARLLSGDLPARIRAIRRVRRFRAAWFTAFLLAALGVILHIADRMGWI